LKIGIIGGGKWGLSLRFAFMQNNRVYLTSRSKKEIDNFVSAKEILDIEYLVFVISAQYAREWMQNNFKFKNQKILVASKGIEDSSNKFLNDIFTKFLPQKNIAYLSGPSFASEVIQSLPTAVVVSSVNKKLAKKYSSFFPNFIKAYVSTDIVGAEASGAYKNVIAIASGICDGLKLGKNAAAALISRGLVEMQRFGVAYGAKEETFSGLGGAGDLFLTASSNMSRNFRVGIGIAKGKSQVEILEELGEVAEGIGTTYALNEISKTKGLYLPIAKEVYEMLEGKSPIESLKDLLSS